MATLLGGIGCVDPAALARACAEADPPLPTDRWLGKANSFAVPVGREPGRGWALLRKSALTALTLTADLTLTFSGADAAHVRTLRRITLLHAECVTPGSEADPDATHLCELVDRRYHLARVPIDRAYNLPAADGESFLAATLNAGAAWTWQGVVTDLAAVLGIGALPLPFAPNGAPENLAFWAPYSAWDALCDVLDRLACAVEYDPGADAFTVVRLGAADAAGEAAQTALAGARLWDGYSAETARGWRPQAARVLFPRLPQPTGGTSPVYAVDVALPAAAGVVAGTAVQLADDLTAVGATGTPSNAAALAARAAERAADWLRKREGYERRLLRVYRDFQSAPGLLGPTLGRLTYDDRGGPFATLVRAEPDGALERWRPSRGQMQPWGASAAAGGCGPSWLAALRPSDCVRVAVTYTTPSIPAPAPVTTCAQCPGGAAGAYTVVVAGMTGDLAPLNGTWTFTHSTGCTWVGTRAGGTPSGWTATLGFGTANALLNFAHAASSGNISYAVSGLTACTGPLVMPLDEVAGPTGTYPATLTATAVGVTPGAAVTQTLTLSYDAARRVWASAETVEVCGVEYTAEVDAEAEELTLVGPPPAGGGAAKRFTKEWYCGGCAHALFAFGRVALCPCSVREGDICDDVVTVRAEYVACYEQDTVSTPCCPVPLPRVLCLTFGAGGSSVQLSHGAGQHAPVLMEYDGSAWRGYSYRIVNPLFTVDGFNPDGTPYGRMLARVVAWELRCEPLVVLGGGFGWVLRYSHPSGDGGNVVVSTIEELLAISQSCIETGLTPVEAGCDTLILSAVDFDDLPCPDEGDPFALALPVLDTLISPHGETIATTASVAPWTAAGCAGGDTALPPGYGGPGWYLTSAGKLELDADSPELCDPTLEIICGPYLTEELLDTAIEDGTCFPEGCTPIAGYTGPGWYWVETSDGSGGVTCEVREITAAERCNPLITICPCAGQPFASEAEALAADCDPQPPHARYRCANTSGGLPVQDPDGPYATYAEAYAACIGDGSGGTGPPEDCCDGESYDGSLLTTLVFSGPVGGVGTALTLVGGPDIWTAEYTRGDCTGQIRLVCTAGAWTVELVDGGGTVIGSASLSPTNDGAGGINLYGGGTVSGGACAGRTFATLIEHPCEPGGGSGGASGPDTPGGGGGL